MKKEKQHLYKVCDFIVEIVYDNCISSALFIIFAGKYSNISFINPNDRNDKPYVLTKIGSDG